MRRLIEFIRSIYLVVLFLAIESVAVAYYARSSHYTQARIMAHTNKVAGGLHGALTSVHRFVFLGSENRALARRVAELEERLAVYEEADNAARLEEYILELGGAKYGVTTATVVSNTVGLTQNLIILNRGRRHGVEEEMSVISSGGAVVGYIVDCTDRYSVAMSILNTSFRASGRLEGADYFGSIHWDGGDPHYVTLDELSKYADPQPGQQVVTTGFSQHFPENVPIGTIESFELNDTKTDYTVKVRLAAEISRLTNVILVANRDLNEIRDLQNSDKVQQHTRPE